MADLEKLKRIRSGLRARVTVVQNTIKDLMTAAGQHYELEAALDQLEGHWTKLQEVQASVESYLEDETALMKEVEGAMAIESTVVDIRAKVQRYLRGARTSSPVAEAGAVGPVLPKWSLPKFSGDALQFPSFWDQFVAAVHGRSDLSDVAKLIYLKSSLAGEALDALDGFQVTNANYPVAVDTLHERFGRESLVVESHILSLLKLTSEPAPRDGSLRALFDKMNYHTRALAAIGKPVDEGLTAEEIVIVLFKQLLPAAIRKRWEQRVQSITSPGKVTLKLLLDFLRAEVDIEESAKQQALGSKRRVEPSQRRREEIPKNESMFTAVELQTTTRNIGRCALCSGRHIISSCPSFLSMLPRRRLQTLKEKGLCFLCLEPGHMANVCKGQGRCTVGNCGGRHHELLHRVEEYGQAQVGLLQDRQVGHVLLQTARARIRGWNGLSREVTCLFDAGAQRSFIRTAIANDLDLKGSTERISICAFGSRSRRSERTRCVRFSLEPLGTGGRRQWMQALCLPRLCEPLQQNPPIKRTWSHVHNLTLADKFPRAKAAVDILIGLDYYYEFIPGAVKKGRREEPLAVQSSLGWLLCGPTDNRRKGTSRVLHVGLDESANSMLRRFWQLDSIGVHEEEEVQGMVQTMKSVDDLITFDGCRYTVRLPWKSDVILPNNRRQAFQRLDMLEKRLERNEQLAQLYEEGMQSYITNDFVERVQEQTMPPVRQWYLPHHPVTKKDSLTTKCRIVFDGSACYKGISLNQLVEVGPPLQRDIVGILLRFRRFPLGLHGDIEKMFLQIALHEDDRDVARFLWRENGRGTEPSVFRFTRLCFGLSCSPFLALAVTQQHARLNAEKYGSAAEAVLNNMYVDDLVMSFCSEEELILACREVSELMKAGGFRMSKWVSNVRGFADRTPNSLPNTKEPVKTLGVKWFTDIDWLAMNEVSVEPAIVPTKRFILKILSKVFDPLGVVAPFLTEAKLLMQLIWKTGQGWDDQLSPPLLRRWQRWMRQLPVLPEIRYKRWIGPSNPGQPLQLHVFCDASEAAFGAVVYLKALDRNGCGQPNLLIAKARVAPVKQVTLPRLELLAALIGARLANFVKGELGLPITQTVCWSDSNVALSWINSESQRWKPFVRHRVAEIQRLTKAFWWRHCSTHDNPADLLSRGSTLERLQKNNLWWYGPEWLKNHETSWPANITQKFSTAVRKEAVRALCVTAHPEPECRLTEHTYEKLETLFRITAWCLRFVHNVKRSPKERTSGPLDVEELCRAEQIWFRKAQICAFQTEIDRLKRKQRLLATSRLVALDPFLDENDLLRVGGRLQFSSAAYETRHPLILPNRGRIVEMVIQQCHQRNFHCGVEHTLSLLRQKFWILKGRSSVKQVVRACVVCRRYGTSQPMTQKMAALPASRVCEGFPFERTGLDFAGPLYVRNGKGKTKSYVCLFTCMITRAVHLELLADMSTKRFLHCLRRFIARRGQPTMIQSDNFRTFKNAERELQELFKTLDIEQISREMNTCRIHWSYITERAPWAGGYWERLVKSIKAPLRKVLGRTTLDFDELRTVLCEIEAQVNSRPLTFVGDDAADGEALTPFHFLTGRGHQALPERKVDLRTNESRESQEPDLRKRWAYQQSVLAHFWKRWRQEYIVTLSSRKKWLNSRPEPQIGDIVLISEDNVPRGRWPMGRIVRKCPGNDGVTRTVQLKTVKGLITRPLARLHLLEAAYRGDSGDGLPSMGAAGCSGQSG